MFILISFISIVIAPLIILILLKILRVKKELQAKKQGYITFGGDDMYQQRNIKFNIHDAVMVAKVSLDMNDEQFNQLIQDIKPIYSQWYERLETSIMPEHKPTKFAGHIDIWDEYKDFTLDQNEPILCKYIFCKKEKKVILLGNHIFLGGYLLSHFVQLLFCNKVYDNIFPKNKYYPIITEVMILALFTQLALFKLSLVKESIAIPLYNDDSKIKRYYVKFSKKYYYSEGNNKDSNILFRVIAKHIHVVMTYMNKKRLKVSLPISFSNKISFNTVGAIFLDIAYESDWLTLAKTIKKIIKKKRYQVSASNHIQRIFPTRKLSAKARSLVDLTLTVVPQKTLPNNLVNHQLKDYQFSMLNIRYPVYIMAFIFEEYVHSSFMINTPAFDTNKFRDEESAESTELPMLMEFDELTQFVEN